MPKLRVYQLARELNRDNSEIIRELQHLGVPVTSHSTTVEDRIAEKLRRDLGVYVADSGARVSAGDDDIIAVEPVEEQPMEATSAPPEPPPVEAEPPRVEAKTEIKVYSRPEPKHEPKVEEKAPIREPKVAAPPPPAPAAAPPVVTAPPAASV